MATRQVPRGLTISFGYKVSHARRSRQYVNDTDLTSISDAQ